MRHALKLLGFMMLAFAVLVAALWVFGPYEDADLSTRFDETVLEGGVDTYLAAQEARFDDITAGVEKQVVWVKADKSAAPWSVVYLHGFSATAQEIRPVPDAVAQALGANLVLTRLKGHGRAGAAMAEATVAAWMHDVAEALTVARKVGSKVLILSTSTGGTLAAAAALDEALMEDVAGIVMVSPNFGVNNALAPLLTWPAAQYWMPLLAGETRSFRPANAAQGKYWTTTYPSVAALPMAALVKKVVGLDFAKATVPALFIFSDADAVVRPDITREVAAAWGGPAQINAVITGPQDDPSAHVIAGDILSPNQTAPTVAMIVKWAKGL